MDWQPANPVQEAMRAALERDDASGYFQVVAKATLFVPALDDDPFPRPLSVELDGSRSVLAFTSARGAQAVPGADTVLAVGYRELVEKWPDPDWQLALDPGTPIGALVPVDAVIRAALGEPAGPAFVPANAAEQGMALALAEDDPDLLMDVLTTATVCLPATGSAADPGDVPTRRVGGVLAVFTSPERLTAALTPPAPYAEAPFVAVAAAWPPGEPMAVNPGSPIEVLVAADKVAGLLVWAAGLPDRYPQGSG